MTKYLVRKKESVRNFYWYLQSNDLFNLRLVSKRWKNVVETCIQKHVDHHPTLPESRNNGTIIQSKNFVPENDFSYQRMHKYHFGASVFTSPQQVDKFIEEMGSFNGNPFPGKFVFTSRLKTDLNIRSQYIPSVVNMFHKFGEYIQILDLEIFRVRGSDLDNFKTILKAISYVPNVFSLTIRGILFPEEEQRDPPTYKFFDQPESQQLFPTLPMLNTFNWLILWAEDSSWAKRMINTYVKQNSSLQTLSIVEYYCYEQLFANLRSLSELHLYVDSTRMCKVNAIRKILSYFPVGQIRKFCLTETLGFDVNTEIHLLELLEIVAKFQVERIILDRIKLGELSSAGLLNFSSIISLSLEDNHELSYKFLTNLPNLQFLHVSAYQNIYSYYHPENQFELNTFGMKLRTYFAQAKAYNSVDYVKVVIPEDFCIWNELPKLEMLSASMNNTNEIVDVWFLREYRNKPFYGN